LRSGPKKKKKKKRKGRRKRLPLKGGETKRQEGGREGKIFADASQPNEAGNL